MTRQVRWGVIGCGGIAARRTIPEFNAMAQRAQVVSVMDIDEQRARDVAKRFDVGHWCTTEKELLAQNSLYRHLHYLEFNEIAEQM